LGCCLPRTACLWPRGLKRSWLGAGTGPTDGETEAQSSATTSQSHVTQLEVPWLPGLCLSLGGGMASLVGDLKLPPSPLQSDRVLQTLGSILRTSFQGATSSGDFSQAYCKSPTP
jgi:hypothetical protein